MKKVLGVLLCTCYLAAVTAIGYVIGYVTALFSSNKD